MSAIILVGLGAWLSWKYTLIFLTHSDEALKIEKFKRARENKIEFAYDYGSLNTSYQTSLIKPYVSNVILEKIIIDLEDEVVSLLEKEKANLETIESLKSKGFESSENVISETENQSENDCHVVEKSVTKRRIQRMCDWMDDNNVFIFDDESIVQICLWIIDSGCTKNMTGNRALLKNFVEKFLERFALATMILQLLLAMEMWLLDQ
nr:ribonuclease H-like domain-containing protein [Tanacetum cinerariifolium]